MFQICLFYSGDRVEAKDILQEAFIKVFTNLESLNAVLIEQILPQGKRLKQLSAIAISQLKTLVKYNNTKLLK